jgi:predicted HTH domain antitoxin
MLGQGVDRKGGIGMTTKELNVTLPLTVSEDEAKLLFAVKLYEVGRVSLGQAARMAGFSKRAFLDVLGRHRVPVFHYPEGELEQEIGP